MKYFRTSSKRPLTFARPALRGSVCWNLATTEKQSFRWVALAGQYANYVGGTTPRDFSPCGVCLDRNAPQLYLWPARYFTYIRPITPPIVEGLVIPFHVDGRAIGTIW